MCWRSGTAIWKKNNDERSLPGAFEEEPATVLETKPRAVRRISAGQRPQTRIEAHEALVPTPKSQHPGDEMAKSEPRPQPDRAFVGSSEAQSRWKKV